MSAAPTRNLLITSLTWAGGADREVVMRGNHWMVLLPMAAAISTAPLMQIRQGSQVESMLVRGGITTTADRCGVTVGSGVSPNEPAAELDGELPRVQALLKPDQAIVGWHETPAKRGGPEAVVWAYVIRDRGPVTWILLGVVAHAETELKPSQESATGVLASQKEGYSAALENLGQPVGTGRLLTPIRTFRDEVSRLPLSPGISTSFARTIFEERFAPLAAYLKGVRHIVVVASGDWLGVPVEALVVAESGQRLGDFYTTSYAPSVAMLVQARVRGESFEGAEYGQGPRRRPATCLAVGDPPYSPGDLAQMSSCQGPGHSDLSAIPGSCRSEESLQGNSRESVAARDSYQSSQSPRASPALAHLMCLRRLPSSRDEVIAVARHFGGGSTVLLGPQASEQELLRASSEQTATHYDVIHIATHAITDDERPERSALVLSQVDSNDGSGSTVGNPAVTDGCLSAQEIGRKWNVRAQLVTLSGCRTGLMKLDSKAACAGLAATFLRKGAQSVIGSLWEVEDRSTSMLMARFYDNWLGGNTGPSGATSPSDRRGGSVMSKAAALQEARQWLREWRAEDGSQPYAHPFFWAGFVLIGDPD